MGHDADSLHLRALFAAPQVADLRHLIRKQLGLHQKLCKAAKDDSLVPLPLWIVSPGVPVQALAALSAQRVPGWPPGFYSSGPLLELWLVVLPELPSTPETRMLRLLGPPKQRLAAMHEVAALPHDDPAKQPQLEILSELIYLSKVKLESDESLSQREKDNMTELRRQFEEWKASLRSEGKVEGKTEGEARGKAEGRAEALLAVLQARGVTVPAVVREQILATRDIAQLDRLLVEAATATSAADLHIAAA